MEIIRGSLESISRPASSEQTGNRVSRASLPHCDRNCPTAPFTLVVLTDDAADIQIQTTSEEATVNSSPEGPDRDHCHVDVTDEDKKDSKLNRAIKEMKRLDDILNAKICREKEVKRQRKELQAKLWQEFLQNKPKGHSESAHEAMNTRLFLALEAPTGAEEEADFVPLFETEVPDCEHDKDSQHQQSEKRTECSFEAGYGETREEKFESSQCGLSKGKKKQDFVKRNIELVSGEEGQVLLTQAEKEHLAELLQETDEEEEDSARGADSEEDMWALSSVIAQGYTPDPSDLEQLIDIDSKMHLLLPLEEFLSVRSPRTNFSMSQGYGSDVAWKCYGDPQPGEKVLQDIKERREQERRLQEIQQQLEILSQGQEMTRFLETTELCLVPLLSYNHRTVTPSQNLVAKGTTQECSKNKGG
uniref:Fibrous sheath-interacting protein 1 n=1 Tax=Monopterus albus TaxID=43700 RepID=A0A3Q3JT30_MONAL|nr:fibrous sheath-interacting protein 1 isoform X2 [Monopterus albus]